MSNTQNTVTVYGQKMGFTDLSVAKFSKLGQLNSEYERSVAMAVPPCVFALALNVSSLNTPEAGIKVADATAIVTARAPYVTVWNMAYQAILAAPDYVTLDTVTWTWPASS